MIHIIAFVRATLTGCDSFCLQSRVITNRKLCPAKEAPQLHILRSVYSAGSIGEVTLQPSDQIPSPVDWGWKYFKGNRFAVDWCGVYHANLNDYIFTCTCERLYILCKCVKKEVLCLPFCSCVCIATREHSLYYIGNFIYTYTRAYLEPSQTSNMEFFCGNS